jgi:hypothetical protein
MAALLSCTPPRFHVLTKSCEGQNVPVVDGVHDGVGVELFAKDCSVSQQGPPPEPAFTAKMEFREAEDMVVLERLDDLPAHVAELGAMALVEDEDAVLPVAFVRPVPADEDVELLYRGDDDAGLGVLELLLQDLRGGVAVGRPLLESVVLPHGLVVQVLAIHDAQP